MTIVINTIPANTSHDSSGTNAMIILVTLFLMDAIFVDFGLPMISKMMSKGVQFHVPEDINVTVNQGEK